MLASFAKSLPEILQLLCASFSAYGYQPMLLFRILFKINLIDFIISIKLLVCAKNC